mmetsp:Transcript_5739/g.14022  ORF Transcript_5739/g.14022 Transcript_5739/m.14022 type:complete len:220 (-) Transcript_5739:341-1000(-)
MEDVKTDSFLLLSLSLLPLLFSFLLPLLPAAAVETLACAFVLPLAFRSNARTSIETFGTVFMAVVGGFLPRPPRFGVDAEDEDANTVVVVEGAVALDDDDDAAVVVAVAVVPPPGPATVIVCCLWFLAFWFLDASALKAAPAALFLEASPALTAPACDDDDDDGCPVPSIRSPFPKDKVLAGPVLWFCCFWILASCCWFLTKACTCATVLLGNRVEAIV